MNPDRRCPSACNRTTSVIPARHRLDDAAKSSTSPPITCQRRAPVAPPRRPEAIRRPAFGILRYALGQACTLRCDASRISCASMLTRVSAAPSWQMKPSWPGGGSGHTHQRPSSRCPRVDLPRGYRNGLSGSSSYLISTKPPVNAWPPPANSTPILKLSWDMRGHPGLGGRGSRPAEEPGSSGRRRRVTKNSKPLL